MSISNLEISTIISQCLILFLLGGLGFLCAKTKYMPATTGVTLSSFVLRVAMPSLILSKMMVADFTSEEFYEGFKLAGFAIISLLLVYLISVGVCKILKLSVAESSVYSMQSMFGNISFFALPLLLALFGDKGVIYGLFFNMGNDILLWSLGIRLATKHKDEQVAGRWKHFINANTIAFVLGLLIMLLDVNGFIHTTCPNIVKSGYDTLYTTLNMIGSTTSSVSMIFIGFIIASSSQDAKKAAAIKNRRKSMATAIICAQKMLVVPTVMCFVLLGLRALKVVSDSVLLIGILQLAMPVGTTTVSLATEHGSDYLFGAKNVFATTICAIVTLPMIAMLLKFLA